MWNRLTSLGTPKQSHSVSQIEEDIRRQLAELERQTVAFHEAIGFLRALLAIASEQEQVGRARVLDVAKLASMATDTATESVEAKSLALAKEIAAESWRHDRLYAHSLRQLYHRLLEAKRRFLYQWHQHLTNQVELLPTARRAPITALLENSLQGILAVGVGQVEAQYAQQFQQMLEQMEMQAPKDQAHAVLPPLSREEAMAGIATLCNELERALQSALTTEEPLSTSTERTNTR